jgi:hypothetical protein
MSPPYKGGLPAAGRGFRGGLYKTYLLLYTIYPSAANGNTANKKNAAIMISSILIFLSELLYV